MPTIYVTDAGRLYGPFEDQGQAEAWADSHNHVDSVLGIVRLNLYGTHRGFIANCNKAHEMGSFQVLVHQYSPK